MAAFLPSDPLDRIPLWRGDHVGVKQLRDDFAQYLYLPRLRDSKVLLKAVRDGTARLTWEMDAFAYAEGRGEGHGRYLGLRAGEAGSVILDGESLVVKPEAARRQLDADEAARPAPEPFGYEGADGTAGHVRANDGAVVTETGSGTDTIAPPPPQVPRRFHGSVKLDATRSGRDAGKIADEVIAHLTGLLGSQVEVTLEIQAEIPEGVPDHVVRTVTENCRTLRFTTFGFEER